MKYKQADLSALIFLPKKNDINKYIQNFNYEKYNNILNSLSSESVNLKLPKFELTFEENLNNYLIKLGIKDAFDEKKADFSLMRKLEKTNLSISEIIHKTYIKVDEEGKEATSVTAVSMRGETSGRRKNQIMEVNRPFLFIIRFQNYILFISKIEDLEEEKNKEIKNENSEKVKIKKRKKSSKSRSVSRSRSRSRNKEE